MTPKEAMEAIEIKQIQIEGKAVRVAKFFEGLGVALQALEKQIPKKPEMKAMDGFAPEVASSLCCPTCGGSVTNYWVRGAKPKHCQFCGQAIDWGVEAKQ